MVMKNKTFFVDIDGTLIKYRNFADLRITNPVPIQSVVEKINSEYEKGSYIVVVTARPITFRSFTIKELKKIGLKYHKLLLGIGRGERVLINDKDPAYPTQKRATAINLVRDKGIKK